MKALIVQEPPFFFKLEDSIIKVIGLEEQSAKKVGN